MPQPFFSRNASSFFPAVATCNPISFSRSALLAFRKIGAKKEGEGGPIADIDPALKGGSVDNRPAWAKKFEKEGDRLCLPVPERKIGNTPNYGVYCYDALLFVSTLKKPKNPSKI